jgi:hypothetical protein
MGREMKMSNKAKVRKVRLDFSETQAWYPESGPSLMCSSANKLFGLDPDKPLTVFVSGRPFKGSKQAIWQAVDRNSYLAPIKVGEVTVPDTYQSDILNALHKLGINGDNRFYVKFSQPKK